MSTFKEWTTPTALTFSLLSSMATSLALIIFGMTLPKGHVNIRTKLVINLLIAEWINSTNNSISGVYANFSPLIEGPACTISVQAADLSTLLIAVVTFLVLKTDSSLSFDAVMAKLDRNVHWIFAIVWMYPLLTATIALFVIGYGPSGNWCWIKGDPQQLGLIMRYTMTHGLRMAIFITIIVLYTILAIHLRKVASQADSSVYSDSTKDMNEEDAALRRKRKVIRAAIVRLIAFPTAYVILWIPGMANRIAEAVMGAKNVPPAFGFFQAFTQLIGFADAALVMWNLRTVMKSKSATDAV